MNALVNQGYDVNVMPLSTYMKLFDERSAKTDIRLSLASHSYIYPLGIAEDILVEVAKNMYPVDFMILDIKEDKSKPFILGTPFLITAKAVIKFDKGTITLRSGKSKISFHRIPGSPCKRKKGIKNDIEPVALIMTVNRLVLEWEERIKLHLEREMKFNQWKSKNFKGEHPTLVIVERGMDDEGEVTERNCILVPAFCLLRFDHCILTHCVLVLRFGHAFCLKDKLRFASRYAAFCFKIS
nr:hypothetical protein [Tanacetum cinerariifolium]